MIGLIQKNFLDLVESNAGADGVEKVRTLAQIPVDRVFRIGDVYGDDEFQRLFAATCTVLSVTPEKAYELFADQFFKDATVRFGKWFALAKNSYDFLVFQTTIHNTFASGVVDPDQRQAVQDKTSIVKVSDRYLITHYRSPNKLCGLYRALGLWVANYYGDRVEMTESKCLHSGDSECEIHVKWLDA